MVNKKLLNILFEIKTFFKAMQKKYRNLSGEKREGKKRI